MSGTSRLSSRLWVYSSGLALLLSIGLIVYDQAQKRLWKAEIRRLNEKWSYWEARNDFIKSGPRLLRISGENPDLRFTGEHEGPFEVWQAVYFPSSDEMSAYSEEQFVYFYNLYMRNLQLWAEQKTKEKEKNKIPATNAPDQKL